MHENALNMSKTVKAILISANVQALAPLGRHCA